MGQFLQKMFGCLGIICIYMCTSGNFSRCCLGDLIIDIDTPSISHCLSGALLWFAMQGIL